MKQITIVAPVQDGLVATISRTLGDAEVNINSLEAFDVQKADVVVLTVDQYDRALQVLRDAGFNAISEDAVVVCVHDEPGSLARLTERLYDGGIDVHSVRILQRQSGLALVSVVMEPREKGMALVQDLLVSRVS